MYLIIWSRTTFESTERHVTGLLLLLSVGIPFFRMVSPAANPAAEPVLIVNYIIRPNHLMHCNMNTFSQNGTSLKHPSLNVQGSIIK